MRQLFAVLIASIYVIAAAGIASAGPTAGGSLAGVLTTSVDTANAYVGEAVTLSQVRSPDGTINGAHAYGSVTKIVRAGQGRPAQLQMTFTSIVLPSGASYGIDGIVTGVQAQTHTNALKEAAGAVAGMVVGNIIGKTIFHAATGIGGFLGAAGGFLVAKNNRQNMVVPAGSAVRIQVLTVRRQARHY